MSEGTIAILLFSAAVIYALTTAIRYGIRRTRRGCGAGLMLGSAAFVGFFIAIVQYHERIAMWLLHFGG